MEEAKLQWALGEQDTAMHLLKTLTYQLERVSVWLSLYNGYKLISHLTCFRRGFIAQSVEYGGRELRSEIIGFFHFSLIFSLLLLLYFHFYLYFLFFFTFFLLKNKHTVKIKKQREKNHKVKTKQNKIEMNFFRLGRELPHGRELPCCPRMLCGKVFGETWGD